MTETFKPARPTEYEGVVFRSKSEAIFARALTLRGFLWEYEPGHFGLPGGWYPDFRIATTEDVDHSILTGLVEYKPSLVTETFMAELHDRFGELCTSGLWCGSSMYGLLACGSSYNSERHLFEWNPAGGWRSPKQCLWRWDVFRHINEAATYRYDLKQQPTGQPQ